MRPSDRTTPREAQSAPTRTPPEKIVDYGIVWVRASLYEEAVAALREARTHIKNVQACHFKGDHLFCAFCSMSLETATRWIDRELRDHDEREGGRDG